MKSDAHLNFRVLPQAQEPFDRRCKGCGTAPMTFRGEDGREHPNRFLSVSGSILPMAHRGVFCERCIGAAHRLAKARKAS